MPLPSSSRSQILPALVLTIVLVVVFCLGLVHENPQVFWNDDYQISILPVFSDVARSWREGHWPLLSPYSWACGNLAGEYQYGTFSLFVNAVAVAVWQWPLSFAARAAAMSIVHLAVLAAGGCLLARQRRLPSALAVMVGLISALNGWEIGWGATDWFGALAAHAWLPWAWWAFEVALEPLPVQPTPRQRLRWLLPAPFVYLVLTGGFPYTVVMLMLITGWLGLKALAERRGVRSWLPLLAGWVFGLGLSAPAWLSLLAAMRGSSRAQGVGPGNHAWTVPLSALPGAILPTWSTNWHNFSDEPSLHAALELTGAFVPLAGLIACVACRRRLARACRWDLLLLGVILLLCLLPSPGVFRWSFRWLPLLHIVLALVGAQAWQLLAGGRTEPDVRRTGRLSWRDLRQSGGWWATVAVAAAWLGMSLGGTSNPDAITHSLPAWMLGCTLIWLAADLLPGSGPWRRWLPAAFALATLWLTYQHLPTNCGLPKYTFDASLADPTPLSRDRLYLSFYRAPEKFYVGSAAPPGFGTVMRPGSTNLFAGLRFINGYSPIMGAGIGRRLRIDTHGEIPPEVARDLLAREAGPAGLLAALGVDGILIARNYPLDVVPPADEWTPVQTSEEGTVYHRHGPPLAAVTLTEIGSAPTTPPRPLKIIENSRQTVVVDVSDANAGGLVTYRRAYFPGYVASVDGTSTKVASADLWMPTVLLTPGQHRQLVLQYRPAAVVWGAAAAGLALLTLTFTAALSYRAGSQRIKL